MLIIMLNTRKSNCGSLFLQNTAKRLKLNRRDIQDYVFIISQSHTLLRIVVFERNVSKHKKIRKISIPTQQGST